MLLLLAADDADDAAGVEVVSAPSREGTRDPLKHFYLFSAENLNIMFGTRQMDVHMNKYVSEAAIPQIVEIRYSTLQKKKTCPTFSVSRLRAAVCRISAHSCPSYTFFISCSEAKSRKNVPPAGRLQRGPPGVPPAPPPHQARGPGVAAKLRPVFFGFAWLELPEPSPTSESLLAPRIERSYR